MAKKVLTPSLIVLLHVLVGCQSTDSGTSQLVPTQIKPAPVIEVATASETDIVEQMVFNRQAYRQGLELLVKRYSKTGDNRRLIWAKRELAALNAMPKYNYIVGAGIAGPDLRVSASIPEADYLYKDGRALEKKAGPLPIFKNENLLRLALSKYNELIRKHPASDKIDDAAYRAGGICEYFKDYTIAISYYERVSQWDPDTIYPASFKKGYILDTYLHRRAEALEAYQQFVEKGGGSQQQREFAQRRIEELTKSGQ